MLNMQMISQLQAAMQNPMAYASKMLGVQIREPNEVIQHLMNAGKLSQYQYDQLRQTEQQLRNNPDFMRMMRG